MKIKCKVATVFLALIAAITVGLVSYRIYLSKMPYSLENMDYIEVDDTDSLIRLKSVKEIGSAFWKGSCDGVLFYKNGECLEVQISVYGNFFGIKGDMPNSLSKGVLYEYVTE